jgi:SulP family sulfate permease
MSDAADSLRAAIGTLTSAIEGHGGQPLAWSLRRYTPDLLRGDLVAGFTVASLIVPLSIGYAGVAGLPPEVGLYASFAPLLAYAIFGSSRTLIVGPDASTAALIGATIAPLAVAADERTRLAAMLGLMVGAVFFAMRLARLGFLADFLSRPILVGYLTGVGITVALGQVEKILGGPAFATTAGVLGGIDWTAANPAAVIDAVMIAVRGSGVNAWSIAVGGTVIAVIYVGRRVAPRLPMALIAILGALVVSALLDLGSKGVDVLGPVPGGLPPIGVPSVTPGELIALIPGALGLAVLSFADTSATGRSFAARHGEQTDANRELVALAAADVAAGVTSGYPISSSPSRTSASEGAGGRSQMVSVVAALTLAVVLVLFTGPLAYLPTPALGAVILMSVMSLIDVRELRRIWLLKRSEGIIALLAVAGVVFYGTLTGVGFAVLLAALNIVRRAAWPQIAELGRMPDGTWRDLERRAGRERVRGVVVVRFSGPMFFANASALATRIRGLLETRPDAEAVVIDLQPTADVDLTAGNEIRSLAGELARSGHRLAVAGPMGRVRDELRAYGLDELMAPTEGVRGSVDDVLRGLGIDPTQPVPPLEPGPTETAIPPAPTGSLRAALDNLPIRVVGAGVVIIAGAAVLAALLATQGLGPKAGPRDVPNLVGLSLDRGAIAASNAGFELGPGVYLRSATWPEGTIIDQDPEPGTLADPGSTITPVVSTGRQQVLVPDVIGMPEADAIARLTGAGLVVRRGGAPYDAVVPAGDVLTTEPAPETQVALGTTITYTVSSGPEPTSTPAPSPTGAPGTTPPSTGRPTLRPSTTPTSVTSPTEPPSESPGPSELVEPSASSSPVSTPGAASPGAVSPGPR